jgi:biopolymer transport protein ExbD
MSGGAVAESSRGKGKGKGGRRPKRRIHIRIDMTPMVDIVMLLLIFYMVTTVFSMPQAMEINLPPEEETETVEVKESRLLTIRIDGENHFLWNIGDPAKNLPQLLPSIRPADDTLGYLVDPDSLRSLLKNLNYDIERLNTLILIREDAKYSSMVDILDEIDLLERSWNAAKAKELGIKVEDLDKPEYKEQKFSYRYAMGKWEDTDDRIVDYAINALATGGGE